MIAMNMTDECTTIRLYLSFYVCVCVLVSKYRTGKWVLCGYWWLWGLWAWPEELPVSAGIPVVYRSTPRAVPW